MRKLFLLLGSFWALQSFSQNEVPFPKFGKVTLKELQNKVYSIDSQAKAVVLQDVGVASIEGNSKGWFSIVLKRHKIVHILKQSGYSLANVEVPLYRNSNNDEERISNIKAVTYNIENGKLVQTKMDKSNLFTENVSKSRILKKFTIPNVKEGSIIEYQYEVNSEFFSSLDPWYFQTSVPVLWSEFTFNLPGFFTYAPLLKGYLPLSFTERKERTNYFSVTDRGGAGAAENYSFSAPVTDLRWGMINVPALETESFTSSIRNHTSRLEFQLLAQGQPLKAYSYQKNWFELTRSLMQSESFGEVLNSDSWVSDEMKPAFANFTNQEEKARKIFEFVRDNFTCLGNSGGIYMTESLKNTIKNRKGYVSDINLVLAGLLKHNQLDASPVILSTTGHGFVHDAYPDLSSYNYVVIRLKLNGKEYWLDASDPLLGFNHILPNCYNGSARIIGDEYGEIIMNSRNYEESSTSMVILANDNKGKWVGSVSYVPGKFESYNDRREIREKGVDPYLKEIEKSFGGDVTISEPVLDSLKSYDNSIFIRYGLNMNLSDESLIYINPMFGEQWKKNPFASAKRSYPVEIPYAIDETHTVTMEVPAGYEVDELPKQMMLKLDEEGSGFFEYRLSHSGSTISFRSRLKLNKTFFMPEEYDVLREFFAILVKKHSEQIVFKKIAKP